MIFFFHMQDNLWQRRGHRSGKVLIPIV